MQQPPTSEGPRDPPAETGPPPPKATKTGLEAADTLYNLYQTKRLLAAVNSQFLTEEDALGLTAIQLLAPLPVEQLSPRHSTDDNESSGESTPTPARTEGMYRKRITDILDAGEVPTTGEGAQLVAPGAESTLVKTIGEVPTTGEGARNGAPDADDIFEDAIQDVQCHAATFQAAVEAVAIAIANTGEVPISGEGAQTGAPSDTGSAMQDAGHNLQAQCGAATAVKMLDNQLPSTSGVVPSANPMPLPKPRTALQAPVANAQNERGQPDAAAADSPQQQTSSGDSDNLHAKLPSLGDLKLSQTLQRHREAANRIRRARVQSTKGRKNDRYSGPDDIDCGSVVRTVFTPRKTSRHTLLQDIKFDHARQPIRNISRQPATATSQKTDAKEVMLQRFRLLDSNNSFLRCCLFFLCHMVGYRPRLFSTIPDSVRYSDDIEESTLDSYNDDLPTLPTTMYRRCHKLPIRKVFWSSLAVALLILYCNTAGFDWSNAKPDVDNRYPDLLRGCDYRGNVHNLPAYHGSLPGRLVHGKTEVRPDLSQANDDPRDIGVGQARTVFNNLVLLCDYSTRLPLPSTAGFSNTMLEPLFSHPPDTTADSFCYALAEVISMSGTRGRKESFDTCAAFWRLRRFGKGSSYAQLARKGLDEYGRSCDFSDDQSDYCVFLHQAILGGIPTGIPDPPAQQDDETSFLAETETDEETEAAVSGPAEYDSQPPSVANARDASPAGPTNRGYARAIVSAVAAAATFPPGADAQPEPQQTANATANGTSDSQPEGDDDDVTVEDDDGPTEQPSAGSEDSGAVERDAEDARREAVAEPDEPAAGPEPGPAAGADAPSDCTHDNSQGLFEHWYRKFVNPRGTSNVCGCTPRDPMPAGVKTDETDTREPEPCVSYGASERITGLPPVSTSREYHVTQFSGLLAYWMRRMREGAPSYPCGRLAKYDTLPTEYNTAVVADSGHIRLEKAEYNILAVPERVHWVSSQGRLYPVCLLDYYDFVESDGSWTSAAERQYMELKRDLRNFVIKATNIDISFATLPQSFVALCFVAVWFVLLYSILWQVLIDLRYDWSCGSVLNLLLTYITVFSEGHIFIIVQIIWISITVAVYHGIARSSTARPNAAVTKMYAFSGSLQSDVNTRYLWATTLYVAIEGYAAYARGEYFQYSYFIVSVSGHALLAVVATILSMTDHLQTRRAIWIRDAMDHVRRHEEESKIKTDIYKMINHRTPSKRQPTIYELADSVPCGMIMHTTPPTQREHLGPLGSYVRAKVTSVVLSTHVKNEIHKLCLAEPSNILGFVHINLFHAKTQLLYAALAKELHAINISGNLYLGAHPEAPDNTYFDVAYPCVSGKQRTFHKYIRREHYYECHHKMDKQPRPIVAQTHYVLQSHDTTFCMFPGVPEGGEMIVSPTHIPLPVLSDTIGFITLKDGTFGTGMYFESRDGMLTEAHAVPPGGGHSVYFPSVRTSFEIEPTLPGEVGVTCAKLVADTEERRAALADLKKMSTNVRIAPFDRNARQRLTGYGMSGGKILIWTMEYDPNTQKVTFPGFPGASGGPVVSPYGEFVGTYAGMTSNSEYAFISLMDGTQLAAYEEVIYGPRVLHRAVIDATVKGPMELGRKRVVLKEVADGYVSYGYEGEKIYFAPGSNELVQFVHDNPKLVCHSSIKDKTVNGGFEAFIRSLGYHIQDMNSMILHNTPLPGADQAVIDAHHSRLARQLTINTRYAEIYAEHEAALVAEAEMNRKIREHNAPYEAQVAELVEKRKLTVLNDTAELKAKIKEMRAEVNQVRASTKEEISKLQEQCKTLREQCTQTCKEAEARVKEQIDMMAELRLKDEAICEEIRRLKGLKQKNNNDISDAFKAIPEVASLLADRRAIALEIAEYSAMVKDAKKRLNLQKMTESSRVLHTTLLHLKFIKQSEKKFDHFLRLTPGMDNTVFSTAETRPFFLYIGQWHVFNAPQDITVKQVREYVAVNFEIENLELYTPQGQLITEAQNDCGAYPVVVANGLRWSKAINSFPPPGAYVFNFSDGSINVVRVNETVEWPALHEYINSCTGFGGRVRILHHHTSAITPTDRNIICCEYIDPHYKTIDTTVVEKMIPHTTIPTGGFTPAGPYCKHQNQHGCPIGGHVNSKKCTISHNTWNALSTEEQLEYVYVSGTWWNNYCYTWAIATAMADHEPTQCELPNKDARPDQRAFNLVMTTYMVPVGYVMHSHDRQMIGVYADDVEETIWWNADAKWTDSDIIWRANGARNSTTLDRCVRFTNTPAPSKNFRKHTTPRQASFITQEKLEVKYDDPMFGQLMAEVRNNYPARDAIFDLVQSGMNDESVRVNRSVLKKDSYETSPAAAMLEVTGYANAGTSQQFTKHTNEGEAVAGLLDTIFDEDDEEFAQHIAHMTQDYDEEKRKIIQERLATYRALMDCAGPCKHLESNESPPTVTVDSLLAAPQVQKIAPLIPHVTTVPKTVAFAAIDVLEEQVKAPLSLESVEQEARAADYVLEPHKVGNAADAEVNEIIEILADKKVTTFPIAVINDADYRQSFLEALRREQNEQGWEIVQHKARAKIPTGHVRCIMPDGNNVDINLAGLQTVADVFSPVLATLPPPQRGGGWAVTVDGDVLDPRANALTVTQHTVYIKNIEPKKKSTKTKKKLKVEAAAAVPEPTPSKVEHTTPRDAKGRSPSQAKCMVALNNLAQGYYGRDSDFLPLFTGSVKFVKDNIENDYPIVYEFVKDLRSRKDLLEGTEKRPKIASHYISKFREDLTACFGTTYDKLDRSAKMGPVLHTTPGDETEYETDSESKNL